MNQQPFLRCWVRVPWVVLLLTRALAAAPPEAEEGANDAARAHFRRGVELYHEGNFDAAAAEFGRAHELISDYRLLFNLAQVQAERHDYVSAIRLFQEYLRLGGEGIAARRRENVLRDISALTERTAELWVSTDTSGAELWVNDTRIGPLPLRDPVLINPGVCRVRVEKPGYRTARHTLVVAGQDKPRLNLPLVEEQTSTVTREAARGPAAPAKSSIDVTPLWISLAGTALSGGAAVGFALMARNADARLEDELNQFPLRKTPLTEARERLETYAALTDAFTVVAAFGAGFSLYYLINPRRTKAEVATRAIDTVHLGVAPGASGLSVSGSF